jgi:hypothetical protein
VSSAASLFAKLKEKPLLPRLRLHFSQGIYTLLKNAWEFQFPAKENPYFWLYNSIYE